ncbi:hypothetical protein [Actinotalea sp.]|uniref:hypothetical protein n=1 Tax=Actinotalea sp. TaxID=1872145 RepID=UPI003566F1C7
MLTFVLVLGLGVAGVAAWLHGRDALPIAERCAALLDGTSWYLDPEQAANAALLGGIAEQRGLPARALTIAIATTLQESKLRNIDYGDRDSLGLFQQRPSQGWGTPEQVQDPVHATNAFYDALVRVDGYLELPITEAAQAVQRSAFPDAYGQHEARARAWASALSGWSPGSLTCTLPEAGTADPEAFAGLVARDLGVQPTIEGTTAVLDASALPDGEAEAGRLGWAVAQWAVGTAGQTQAVEVRTADQVWTRSTAGWTASTDPLPTGRVEVSFAAP